MDKRKILIVNDNDELRDSLQTILRELGHRVSATDSRRAALAREDFQDFDLVISDLTDEAAPDDSVDAPNHLTIPRVAASPHPLHKGNVKAFKIDAGTGNFMRLPYDTDELRAIVERTFACKLRCDEDLQMQPHVREKIELELPSDVSLMHSVLQYMIERVARLGVIKPEQSNLFIALDEAFVNAVKHGNRHDPNKFIRISAELSADEARFTVEDEGEGFNVAEVPDPRDAENLFKTSGRGVLLIYNIMDEVQYNARGNRLTMVKRSSEGLLPTNLIEPLAPADTNH
ncbi:MAG: ATP-binding protein [Pyrinomonadaceae bacterium]